ncbi:MAG: PQQ-binding-like beta-propeller repeat protein, partial [Persicimonas sp.]
MDVSWRYPVHHRVESIAFSTDRAFLPASRSYMACIDLQTGQEQWRTKIENVWGWLALSPDGVVYLNQHDELVVLEKDTGRERWKKKLDGTFGWLHAFADCVVVGGWRGNTDIQCLDVRTGQRRWIYPARRRSLHRT